MIDVRTVPAESPEAAKLMRELSDALLSITGRSGESDFSVNDMAHPRALFAVAYLDGEPAGCGAIREFTPDTAELKRMYARVKRRGVGKAILQYLEHEAARLNYRKIVLETGPVNVGAVNFYLSNGYELCENFGKYIGQSDSVCFSKEL